MILLPVMKSFQPILISFFPYFLLLYQTKTTIDQLQSLVSTDSRFRNMRDAINRCDPPSIPYVGMYLTDLSFIEEGTPNYSPDGLLNFSKMRMVSIIDDFFSFSLDSCYLFVMLII